MPVIKWIVADIDGCLTPESSVAWDLEKMGRLAAYCREGAQVGSRVPLMTLCTGRPQPYVEALVKLLDLRLPVICENGAVVYTLHDNRSRFGPGVTPGMVAGIRELRAGIEEDLLPRHPGCILQFGKEAQISIFSEDPSVFPSIQPTIEGMGARIEGLRLDIQASHYYLNISLAGVDKGRAAAELMQEGGIRREEAAGIGDTEGDLPLRAAVGFLACPANARAGMKEAADYVSPLAEIDGVLDILERIRSRNLNG